MSTTKIQLNQGGMEVGSLGHSQHNWWFDPAFPHAFTVYNLDTFYDAGYFKTDHVDPACVQRYADYILAYSQDIYRRQISSVLELGCGGGWFTEEFLRRGIDIIAVEGSAGGYQRTLSRGVPPERVIQHDLRLPLQLNRNFDVVVCTEVAEHIEPPFSSQLVYTIIRHGKVAWFSFEEPGTNESHYHHCNEQPERFWQNLFEFFDYKMIRLPEAVQAQVDFRGRCLFYHRDLSLPVELDNAVKQDPAAVMGLGVPRPQLKYRILYTAKLLLPPIVFEVYRSLVNSRRYKRPDVVARS